MSIIRDKYKEKKEEKNKKAPPFAPAGQSTQLIVGATKSTDSEILSKASSLYSAQKLRRVYYSAFSPIPHGDPGLPLGKAPLIREHRLYQADWLLRFYGFKVDEITTSPEENLNLNIDPKFAWALRNRELFPVNVNSASRKTLLRVPGLGKRNVDKILAARRFHSLSLEDLARIRVPLDKVRNFIIASNHIPNTKILDSESFLNQAKPKALQLGLFGASSASANESLSQVITGEF